MRPHALVCTVVTFGLLTGCQGKAAKVGPRSTLTADAALAARQSCSFAAGTMPGLSIASDAPLGPQIPVDTIVLVMMENRSFDHLLHDLPSLGSDADVASDTASNPDDKNGNAAFKVYHLDDYCFDDPNHGWAEVHGEWDNGAMDGFIKYNEYNGSPDIPADGKRAMGYYTQADLPWFYAAATTFSLADRNFASMLGPTFPNREFFYAATSFGHTGNEVFQTDQPTIMQTLNNGNVDWRVYAESLPGMEIFAPTFLANIKNHYLLFSHFYSDAAAGTLPPVSFVDPDLYSTNSGQRDDFHPPGDIQGGQKFMHDVLDAMMKSPQWKHSAVIFMFDEHGGIYDHVPPPESCAPDEIAPMLGAGDPAGDFKHYGVRVPLIVASPYSKPGYVSHAVYDHTSVTRFVETRFNLPAMTARDANADPLSDMFDFSKAAFATPPTLPDAPIDADKLARCLSEYPLDGGTGSDAPTADAGAPADAAPPSDDMM